MSKKSSDGLAKVGPGRWRARITARDPITGRKRLDTTVTFDADTKAAALAERARRRDELLGTTGEWTVAEAIEQWLPTMPTNTRRVRKGHAERFAERFGQHRLSRVPPAEVQAWLTRLPGLDSTARVHLASIRALYKYARGQGKLIAASPLDHVTPRHTPKSAAELLAELEAPPERRALIGGEVVAFFDALEAIDAHVVPLARMQLLLGCRWSEAVALQWRDIDWETGLVVVRRSQTHAGELGPPKGKKARLTGLGAEGHAFLRGHRAAMEREQLPGWEAWVFPKPVYATAPRRYDMWSYSTVQRRVHEALASAGLTLANVTHAFRHTHNTIARALEQDAALRASMGHSSEKLTEAYTDDSHRAAVAQRLAADFDQRLTGVTSGGVSKIGPAKSFSK